MPKPDKYPRWASQNVTDPVSLSPNVIEPPEEKKDRGWNRLEKPPRNWENWLHRKIYEWIVYFDQNLDFESDAFTPVWSGIDAAAFNTPGVNVGYFSRQGDICYFGIEAVWIGNANTGSLQVNNLPFKGKNVVLFNQLAKVQRGIGPTIAGGANPINIYGLISPNTTVLQIFAEDMFTGRGSQIGIGGPLAPGNAYSAGAQGQFTISGFYFVEAS